MWEITMGVHLLLLIVSTAILAGAVGMIILLALTVNR
jgi:hypothetical protein